MAAQVKKDSIDFEASNRINGLRKVSWEEVCKGLEQQKVDFWERKKKQDERDLTEFIKRHGIEKE